MLTLQGSTMEFDDWGTMRTWYVECLSYSLTVFWAHVTGDVLLASAYLILLSWIAWQWWRCKASYRSLMAFAMVFLGANGLSRCLNAVELFLGHSGWGAFLKDLSGIAAWVTLCILLPRLRRFMTLPSAREVVYLQGLLEQHRYQIGALKEPLRDLLKTLETITPKP